MDAYVSTLGRLLRSHLPLVFAKSTSNSVHSHDLNFKVMKIKTVKSFQILKPYFDITVSDKTCEKKIAMTTTFMIHIYSISVMTFSYQGDIYLFWQNLEREVSSWQTVLLY